MPQDAGTQWNESPRKLQLFLHLCQWHIVGAPSIVIGVARKKRALVGYKQPWAVFTGEGSALVVLRDSEVTRGRALRLR
jgi:hypothetical protein